MIGRPRTRRHWREASFAVLDFETTGLDLSRDHVISYGVVPVEGGRARLEGATYCVIRPPVPLSPASIRVHGIRPEELDEAPPLVDVLDELVDAVAGRILVAHAAGVELGFLDRIRRLHGRPRVRRAVDVLDLADAVAARDPSVDRPPSERLAEVAAWFGVPVTRTHHAFSDALTTAQLFLALATHLEELGHGRVGDLLRAGRPQFARSSWRTPLERTRPVS